MKHYLLLTVIVVSMLLAACAVPAQPAPVAPTPEPAAAAEVAAVEEAPTAVAETTPVATGAIPVEALKNATYSGIYDEPITLTDGLYEGEPYVEGDPSRPTVATIDGVELYGDLDGDGVEDAVVFLIERGGGTAAFTYVGAQLNRDGQPVDAGAAMVEDRTQILSTSIDNGQINLEITTRGPGDGDCCPSYRTSRTYALQDGQLAEVAGEDQELVRISAADLDGTTWTLLEINDDQPALADSEVTISFQDGPPSVSGFGGCNSYTGSFSLSEDNPFLITIGPLASTQKACPEPILDAETAYLTALERVSRWGYAYGQLALAYTDDQGNNVVLLFAPQAAADMGPADDALTGQTWQWASFTSPVEQFDVEMPSSYLLTFNQDGTVNIVADCNNALGSYTDEDGALAIEIGPMTMAACPPDSRSDQFVTLLGGAVRYFFQEGQLFIDLMADGGTMAFVPAPAEIMADDGEGAIAGAPADAAAIPVAALMNATYSGIYDEPITLINGLFEEQPFTVEYLEDSELYGDLDGDGVEDAVVFLLERGGGTANIIYIAAQLNRDGEPVDAGAIRMDEVQIKSAIIEDGQVMLEIITAGPGDADCCVSHKARKAFALKEGRLGEVAGEEQELVRVSAADLDGISWTLQELNYDEPALADVEVTISFQDGPPSVSGFGGCNSYNGNFSLGEDNPFVMTVGPVVATRMTCPEPTLEQETAYFSALEDVAQWGYQFGHLALYYLDDQGTPARLLFAPAGGEITADDNEEAMASAAVAAALPPADIANDEGGPQVITGDWNYTSALVLTHFQDPIAALVNVSPYVQGNWTEWVPAGQQVLGRLISPISPAPVTYEVNIPIRMHGATADLDNDGEKDAGVQVYGLWVTSNLNGNSYLEQLDQAAYRSYLLDPQTYAFREGTLLVYAPDDAQGFPASAGEDGVYFTADDPAVALPAGYTLVTLGSDGQVSFDRSAEATMNTLEEASIASPNFSDQGILESYNSLIDLLKVRYSYTDERGLDWEKIRQTYLPQVQAADEAGDMAAYYVALTDLALSIRDAHVYVTATDAALKTAFSTQILTEHGANVGAGGVELSDGRYVINFVDPEGPAAEAGWQFDTEIVSVDGVPMSDHIASLPLQSSSGNPEAIRLMQTTLAMGFPDGADLTFEYRQPGESEVRSVTLTASTDHQAFGVDETIHPLIEYKKLDGDYGYVRWSGFREPLYMLAIWRKFLEEFHTAPGMVIDLRGNGGGNAELMHTMASYFFPEEKPASYHWLDYYVYDEKANDLVKEFSPDFPLYAPDPALTYGGAVAVLVDEGTASAGEYFPQLLQRYDRAIVVGEHGTEGAGGAVEQAAMPGGITFFFTKGRSFFAGTDELNLEAKGVTLDVRVPVTEESEQAKREGRDPVIEAALETLAEESARLGGAQLVGKTWQLLQMVGAPGAPVLPPTPDNTTITFAEDGTVAIQTDCNQATAEYNLGGGGAITITPTTTLAACPEGSIAEQFVQWLGAAATFQVDSEGLVILMDPESGVVGMLFTAVE